MQSLGIVERRCLAAAEGWLGLGNWQEAKAELDSISPQMREHPAVLYQRWHIHAAAGQWEEAALVARKLSQLLPELPFGWLQLAHSLHALRRTEEARNILLSMLVRFPTQPIVPYKLACYACHLGHLEEARHWLETALEFGNMTEVAKMASEDPELRPLWSKRPIEADGGNSLAEPEGR